VATAPEYHPRMAKRSAPGSTPAPGSASAASNSGAAKSAAALSASMRVVVLHGGESFIIRERSRELARLLEGAYGGCEQFSFDGTTVPLSTVLDELRSYGLMQRHKLVILDNAEQFLARADSHRPAMESYVAAPVAEATLLLRAETWRPGNLDKAIAKVGGTILKCEPPSEDKAVGWCMVRCSKRYQCTIEPDAAGLLVQRTGPHLGRLDCELAKMAAFIRPGGAITRDVVAELTRPSREEEAWGIQAAILSGSPPLALGKLRDLLDVSRVEIVPLMWSVIDLIRKLHAGARMLRQGEHEATVARQLRLFGSGRGPILAVAQRVEPDRLAGLMARAIDADHRCKSGRGDPRRTLEGLTLLVTDEIR
jgi:DNA polymerase III subunit delta